MRHLPALAITAVTLTGLVVASVIAIGIAVAEDALGVNSPDSLKRYRE